MKDQLKNRNLRPEFMKRFAWLFILLLTFAGFAFAPMAHAIDPSTDRKTFIDAVDKCAANDTTCKQWYSADSINEDSQHLINTILPSSTNPKSIYYNGKSTVAILGNVMLAMYTTPPADIALWFQDTGQSLGFIPKKVQAQGQGIGFTGLSPLLGIWKAFRNISYALLAAIMIIIGFMIMFRQKIDPKTVVTVQNALPKIVFALLLITFSYAIAAFFIDLMYLVMAIVVNLIAANSSGAVDTNTASKFMSGGLGTLIGPLFRGGWDSIDQLVKLLFYSQDTGAWWFFQQLNVWTLIPWAGQNVLVGLIVAIAILFGLVRIIFMLVSAYIQIIVAVLIAPFQLMTEALPGSTSFSSWIKNLVANLSVFPITAAMILVGIILTRTNVGAMWTPPFLSGAAQGGVSGLIGLGILLTIPNIANSIKEALKAKAPVEAGFGAILGPVGGGVGQVLQYGYYANMATSLFRKTPGGGHDEGDLAKGIKAQQEGIPIGGKQS